AAAVPSRAGGAGPVARAGRVVRRIPVRRQGRPPDRPVAAPGGDRRPGVGRRPRHGPQGRPPSISGEINRFVFSTFAVCYHPPVPESAEVVLTLPVDRSFTYRVPPGLRDSVRPGMRVKVPFGPREQTGYVVKLADSASFPRIKDLKEAGDEVLADEK